ncbi:MAG: sigma-70 family RNA polymerase sigma factor [bacterium]
MTDGSTSSATRFERVVLPHLDAAYTLARYLTRNTVDADDAVQEGVLRALRYQHTLRSDADARAWLLAIVRRQCYDLRGTWHARAEVVSYEDAPPLTLVDHGESADVAMQRKQVRAHVQSAIDTLSDHLRETLILREVQQCSYEEIAMITEVPLGTVMSRLSRARARVAERLRGIVDVGDLS